MAYVMFPPGRVDWARASSVALRTLAFALLGVALISAAVLSPLNGARETKLANASQPVRALSETRVLENDSWLKSVRNGTYFKRSRATRPVINYGNRSNLGAAPPNPFGESTTDPWASSRRRSETRRNVSMPYRTMCVRLCDGFYFPISTSTQKYRFRRDERTCRSKCGAPTRLFYYPVNGDPSQMKDLRGRPYANLPTAFLYRTSYNNSCKCRAHPWEAAAKKRHKLYALKARRRKIFASRRLRRDRKLRREVASKIRELKRELKTTKKEVRRTVRDVTKKVVKQASADDAGLSKRVDKYLVTKKPVTVVLTSVATPSSRKERAVKQPRRIVVTAPNDVANPYAPGNTQAATEARAKRVRQFRNRMSLGVPPRLRRRSKVKKTRAQASRRRSSVRRKRSWRRSALNRGD